MSKLPPIRLQYDRLSFYILPDGFGSIEENLMMQNIYFSCRELANANTILDLGAHHGSFTIYAILCSKPHTRIYAVEPSPQAYTILLNNVKFFADIIKRKELTVTPLNVAVSKTRGITKLVLTSWSETHHILREKVRVNHEKALNMLDVPSITMDELLGESRRPVAVKMDIEGAEHELFEAPQWLERVDLISLEVHGDKANIIRNLREYGFKVKMKTIPLDKSLVAAHLKLRPRWYGFLIGVYRLIAATTKPAVEIVSAVRKYDH